MEKLRDSWDGTKMSFEKDRAYGFSWPQRNYICSFCKKEFKSAQALGGHMNVHRRDRARLRLHSPSFMESPNPNPNPNLHSFSLPSSNLSCATNPPYLSEKVPVIEHPKHDDVMKNKGVMLELMDARVWKAKEFLRFDLNMDLLRDAKEDLDLELRLGYS